MTKNINKLSSEYSMKRDQETRQNNMNTAKEYEKQIELLQAKINQGDSSKEDEKKLQELKKSLNSANAIAYDRD
ncbi:hypothetical protein [Clostridium butyricum]|uniref:hypothetical protein n=1 Tax=Clostridium butyricum TaxID=1492 RepID=UPI00051C8318|nr:hypothetical protein [Clostridium butyricum]QUF83328.1 hypothetical protein KDJ93_16820 [Clostridium butyricum]